MSVDVERLRRLRLSAQEDDAAEQVTMLRPKFLILIIDEIERLRAEMDHLRQSAGDDSCADLFHRNEQLRAEVAESQAVTLLAIAASEQSDATIAQLRAALTEALDIAAGGDVDALELCRIDELRRLVQP